ncbi:MAG: GNAT family N-acetyltransferase [Maioricimonas sp. JB049]
MASRLRQYELRDIDALCEAVLESKCELAPWMPWCHPHYGRDDARLWVESRPGTWDRNEAWSFLIVDAADRLLGTCGLHRIDNLNRVAELGYWVRTSEAGQGIATAASRQLVDWAFRERDLHRVEILISTENHASLRVAEKLGAQQEGIVRSRLLLHGRRHDCVMFAIVR